MTPEGPGCEAPGGEAAADLASMSRLLDLERYPLHAEASPAYTELVEWCRQQLASLGSVDLPGQLCPLSFDEYAIWVVDSEYVVFIIFLCQVLSGPRCWRR